MRVFPKPHFSWKEPKEFRMAHAGYQKSRTKWWHQPLGVVVIAASLLFGWRMDSMLGNARQPFWPMFAGALTGGVLFAYGLPVLKAVTSSVISLMDKRIGVTRVNATWLEYARFSAFEWRENSEFAALVLHREEGMLPFVLGVPLDVSRDTVSEFLASRGIPNLGTGEEPRIPKSMVTSFRFEVLFSLAIACMIAAPILWFSIMVRRFLELTDLKVTDFPPLSQFALAAHIWVPVILLLTVTFVTWLKLRNPKTPWPKVITFLVGFVLAGIVVVGLHEPIEKATARADSLWKKPQRDEHPHP